MGPLYLGVTRDLIRRVYQHKTKALPGFTSRYDAQILVWYECYDDPTTAIEREKEHQEVAPRVENSFDRSNKSRVG
jgi:putative endonuclease